MVVEKDHRRCVERQQVVSNEQQLALLFLQSDKMHRVDRVSDKDSVLCDLDVRDQRKLLFELTSFEKLLFA